MRGPDPLLAALGDEVRRRRKDRGWTRRDLATHTGISERFLADVETGRANPSIVKLRALAEALGAAPSSLLAGAESGSAHRASRRMLALLGLRGAGKSSVGRAVAERLRMPFVELDAEIERSSGLPLAQLFELNGERAFRRAEREVLRRLVLDAEDRAVLATGGGLVTDSETFALLRAHAVTIWLRARPQEHWNRVVAQGDTRPMEGHDEAFRAMCEILAEREPAYAQADITVDTSGRTIDALADEIVRRTTVGSAG